MAFSPEEALRKIALEQGEFYKHNRITTPVPLFENDDDVIPVFTGYFMDRQNAETHPGRTVYDVLCEIAVEKKENK